MSEGDFYQWRADDGIVNENEFSIQDPKILWVLREPHGSDFDFKEYLQNVTVYPKWKQSYGLVVKVSRVILDNLIEQRNQWRLADPKIMDRIALINVKKTGGSSSVNWNALWKEFELNKDILRDQIISINPDYIFCGGTSEFIKRLKLDKFPVISLYHPQQTIITHEKYIESAVAQYLKYCKTMK